MTTLKPGPVWHPEKKKSGLAVTHRLNGILVVEPLEGDPLGWTYIHHPEEFGWENVEIVKPGHVQVRIDDLDPQTLSEWSQWAEYNIVETVLLRVGSAFIARQVGQGDPPDDEQEIVGDGCVCWVTPEHTWTTHYGAVEPGSQVECNPRCPKHGEKPTSATVKLHCPDCGEAENVTVVMLGRQSNGERWFDLREFHAHTCPPAQPDEPTEFAAKVSVTPEVGEIERFISCGHGWILTNPNAAKSQSQPWYWDELTDRGTVTLGWDDVEGRE